MCIGGEESSDILDHHEFWGEDADGVAHVGPEAGSFPGQAGAGSGVGEVLAGESSGEEVDLLDLRPVHSGDVAEVGPAVGGDDPAGPWVVVAGPDQVGVEDGADAEVEAAVSGEQAAQGQWHRGMVAFLGLSLLVFLEGLILIPALASRLARAVAFTLAAWLAALAAADLACRAQSGISSSLR